MKYLEEFLRFKYKIQPIGKLTYEEYNDTQDGGIVGVEIIIDNYRPGIIVWYADYAKWLEEKYDNLKSNLDNPDKWIKRSLKKF